MELEVQNDGIQLPEQNNLTWVFPVQLIEGQRRENRRWFVDSFDLDRWFKEAVGRYPHHEGGDKDTLDDLRENWNSVKPRLHRELAKHVELNAGLNVDISVDGLRTSASEWEAVRRLSANELPKLTDEQKEVATKLGISLENYARSFVAGEKTRTLLLHKTERLARMLKGQIEKISPRAEITSVSLRTWEHRFDVEIRTNGNPVLLRIDESLVDDLFDSGSPNAEKRMLRIVDLALHEQARVK